MAEAIMAHYDAETAEGQKWGESITSRSLCELSQQRDHLCYRVNLGA